VNILDSPEFFSQQFVLGEYEYATHILFKDRKIVHSINIEYKFDTRMPIKGKDQFIDRNDGCECPYLDLFATILESINFNGLCCVNYKISDNQPLIIEINPRFGGSLCLHFYSFLRHL
jgi:predicted ATP-grasp superfamily ATP-dependent carboligase